MPYLRCLVIAVCLTGCRNAHEPVAVPRTDRQYAETGAEIAETGPYALANTLRERLQDPVDMDSLTQKVTSQDRVRVISKLKTRDDPASGRWEYFDSSYHFYLHHTPARDPGAGTFEASFTYGKTSFRFRDYRPLCPELGTYRCETYGFNWNNTLLNPEIIEIRGRRFLYAAMSYWCMGIGCGCELTFIYDLQTKRPVFLDNYRTGVNGYAISDFDDDGEPDLLVIGRKSGKMKGFGLDEVEVYLAAYAWQGGKPVPKRDPQDGKPYFFQLYSVFVSADHQSSAVVYSLQRNQWIVKN